MFGTAVVCYLFLGGTGAGACFVLAVLGLLVPRDRLVLTCADGTSGGLRQRVVVSHEYRALFAPAWACGAAALALGVVLLAVDLGRADRLLLLLAQPRATYLVVGAYALALCMVLAATLAFVWGGFTRRLSWGTLAMLEIAACMCALVVMAYTGLLLQSLRAVPLWNTAWLPVLFVFSSVSCGFALVLASAQFTGAGHMFVAVMRRVMATDACAIAAEALVFVVLVVSVAAGAGVDASALAGVLGQGAGELAATSASDVGVSTAVPFGARAAGASAAAAGVIGAGATGTQVAAARSVEWLLFGSDAAVFWGGFVAVGLAVPFAAEVVVLRKRRLSANAALLLAACVLVGGFCLRWCLVGAGMHPQLMVAGIE